MDNNRRPLHFRMLYHCAKFQIIWLLIGRTQGKVGRWNPPLRLTEPRITGGNEFRRRNSWCLGRYQPALHKH